MTLSAVCYLGKQNQPLFLKVLNDGDELGIHTAVFAALDIVEERLIEEQRDSSTSSPLLLGNVGPALYFGENLTDYRVCAHVSSTGTKIFCLFEDRQYQDETTCSPEIETLFSELHSLYVDAICNPFLLDTIDTPKFRENLLEIIKKYRRSTPGALLEK